MSHWLVGSQPNGCRPALAGGVSGGFHHKFRKVPKPKSRPERTGSLPNGNLEAGDEHLVVEAVGDFFGRGGLEKQRQRLTQVVPRLKPQAPGC